MNTIKLNQNEYPVISYNKNTYFSDNTITSNASCLIHMDDATELYELMLTPITSIQIYHNDELIYELPDINARIDSVTESLSESTVDVNIYFTFANT